MTETVSASEKAYSTRTARLYGMILVFGLLVTIYTMSHSSKFHIVDEVSLFAVTESIVLRGEVNTNAIAWTQWTNSPGEVLGEFGPEGDVYSKKGPAPAVLAVPWYTLLYFFAQADVGVGLLQGTLLWNGLVTAATAVLLWFTALRLKYDDRVGAALALLYGLATIAWPYANMYFGEPLSAFALLACFLSLHQWLIGRPHMWALFGGIAAGVILTTVTAHAPLIALLGLYGFGTPWLQNWLAQRKGDSEVAPVDRVEWAIGVGLFLAPLLFAGGLLMWYNQARFGSAFDTGYHFDSGEGFTTPIWEGLWGLLFSPYRGVFWFTPLFIASMAAWRAFMRQHRWEALATAAISVVLVVEYSLWWMWWGGFAWGPRFLVPLAPFWVLWLAPWVQEMLHTGGLIERLMPRKRARRRAPRPKLAPSSIALLVLAVISTLVQISAVVVNFVNYEIKLRSIYPTDWQDPLAFGPPAQGITDLFYSPVFGQWQLMAENFVGNTDLAWLWSDGNVQMMLLGVGGAVTATLGLAFAQWWYALQQGSGTHGRIDALPSVPVRALALVLPVLLLAVWLGEVAYNPHYGDPERGYRAILRDICRQADGDEALVTVAPFAYQIPMNWLPTECRAMIPVYGYATNSMEFPEADMALRKVLQNYNRIWFVTGGLPSNDPENTVERWLATNAYKANDTWYDDFRLLDYATATQLRNSALTPLNVTLVGSGTSQVTISAAKASSLSQAGRVLPVEIYYRISAQNPTDLRWFVQLLRPEGYPAALLDTAPDDGYTPFSQLPANVELVERAGLTLPDNLPPGRYELIAGLYDPTQEGAPRLRAADGSDFVRVGYVVVQ
jgi:hypothetical protein